jgi:hypothetical protein
LILVKTRRSLHQICQDGTDPRRKSMRPINEAGWTRIKAAPIFAAAPTDSPRAFWAWTRKQDATLQRVAWFLFRMADAMEAEDGLEAYQSVGALFDPDRIWILGEETRALMADFILYPSRYIS